MNFAFTFLIALPCITAFFMPQWKSIRENVEIVADVAVGQEKRFLYSHNTEGPLLLFVTPCGASVHWRIYSVQGGENELSPTESLDSTRFELIAGQEDDRRMTFFKQHVSKGPLMLVLTSSTPSSARLFLSHSQDEMDAFYPPLPHDTRLAHAVSKGESSETNQVLITWKAADRVRAAEAHRYRFCAIVSRRIPDWAICGELNEGLESIHCVPQTNNSMVIRNLRLGKYYFITLFVRDSLHGSTSSYETLEVNLRNTVESSSQETKKKDESLLLHNAILESGNLSPKKGSTLDYQFVVPTNATKSNKVLLIVHACEGYVRMSVYRNGKLLKRSEPFSGFRRFLVVNVHSGQLRFQISNDDAKPKMVHLWASTQTDQSPYPKLPEDTSVKVVRRSCSTATLQWLRSADEHAEYCIYMRRENANYLEELVSKASNLCKGGLGTSELVGCYSHRGPSVETLMAHDDTIGLIETTVVGLEPSKTYRFDLLATPLQRAQAQSLPYRTVWVRTANSC